MSLKQYITITLAIILLGMSGGVTLYSHFCKGENMNRVSLAKVEHKCAAKEKKSCHKTENSCDDKSDCCTSDVEHETLDQVTIQIDSYSSVQAVETITLLLASKKIEQPRQSIALYTRPPPEIGREINLRLERILC